MSATDFPRAQYAIRLFAPGDLKVEWEGAGALTFDRGILGFKVQDGGDGGAWRQFYISGTWIVKPMAQGELPF